MRQNAAVVAANSVDQALIETVVLAKDRRYVVHVAVATSSVADVVVAVVFDYVSVAENMVPITSLGVVLVKADGISQVIVSYLGSLVLHL